MRYGLLAVVASGLTTGQPAAQAAVTKHISITTGGLSGGGAYYVEFTLTDGGGASDGNSSAAITHFQLTGGALGAVLPPTTGAVVGSLGSILTFTDTSAVNDFAQAFSITSASSVLSFDLTSTNSSTDTVAPDAFTLQLLQSNLSPLATNGPTGTEFVVSNYGTLTPTITGYANTAFNPAIRATISAAPEPGILIAFALGALGLGVLRLSRPRPRSAPAVELYEFSIA